MAAATRILSLNLGSQTIALGEFRAQPSGGLILQNYQLHETLADIAGEGIRYSQLEPVIRQALDGLRLKGGDVNYAVPGQSVFARFVKLPSVDEEKVERIIAFEAQQNVPFPIDEVVWDYQLVGAGTDEQIQVVLVAIKSDLLDEINSAVEGANLRTNIVDVAPMALYNAFRYNYSDLTGCSLLVDIGARTTNLLFIESARVFSRSVPIGGGSITTAIAREFDEPFAAADRRKKRDGFVSLGGAYAEPSDPELARMSKIIRSTMTRLHAELMRSISHYRSQQQGSAPERIFLCGGSASTPYMREFFQEKLQLPVSFFNPLRNVAVAESAPADDLSRSAHLLGEVVGLALRTVTACPMELNLRPASVVRRQTLEKRRLSFMIAAAFLILTLAGWGFYYMRAAGVTRQATERLQEKIDTMRAAETRLAKLRQETTALDSQSAPIIDALNDRSFWVELIEDLNSRLPKEDIWITELVPVSGGKVMTIDETRMTELAAATPTPAPAAGPRRGPTPKPSAPAVDGLLIRGLYLFNPRQQEVVVDFFRNLVSSPFFAIDPNNQSRVIKPSTPTNTEWAYPYELHLDLKTPLKLP
ncbi:MAG TPA: type IV pilus assembly protein PilM [Chthoniobacterales bacterium]|nr:type IV pilus assembly protein PilM [Chthoniobacterales bacterium]